MPGALYRLDTADLVALDQVEGPGYERILVPLVGQARDAFAYLALRGARDPELQPFDWYLGLIQAGAYQQCLLAAWISRLARQPVITDPDVNRPRQVEAQVLLAACPSEWRPA